MGVSSYVALAKSLRGRRRRRRASADRMARELELRDALADRGVRVLLTADEGCVRRRPAVHSRGRLARELGAVCEAVVAGASFAGVCAACLVVAVLLPLAAVVSYGEGPFDER